jgi:hypothetical protein
MNSVQYVVQICSGKRKKLNQTSGNMRLGYLFTLPHLEESFGSSSWGEQNILFLRVFRRSPGFAYDLPSPDPNRAGDAMSTDLQSPGETHSRGNERGIR